MLGYLNTDIAFDDAAWYNSKDIIVKNNGYYQVVRPVNEVTNVTRDKFMAFEVELVAVNFAGF